MKEEGLKWLLLTAIISGVSIFLNKFGITGINSTIFTFSKNIISGILLTSSLIFFQFKQTTQLKPKEWLTLMLIGLTGGSIPFILFFKGLQLIPAAQAALMHKTLFAWASILAFIFLGEKINKKHAFSALLLLIGNALLLKFTGLQPNWGLLLVLTATIFWAAENVISKHALKTMKAPVIGSARLMFGSFFILAYILITGKAALITQLTIPQTCWILFTSILLSAYVYTWYTGLESTPVSTATIILLLGSPITTLLSILFAGATITLSQAAGLILLLSGVLLAVQAQPKTRFILTSSRG